MGKQGPCYHCGITTTPLWRNGPPEKPVLCNACGSRWRTKGTLLNYMPMHSGGFGLSDNTARASLKQRAAAAAAYKHQQQQQPQLLSRKRKEPSDVNSDSGTATHLSSSVEEDTSTRSSLASELSTYDGAASNYNARGAPWETPVPSRKRTSMFRSRASSERISRSFVSVEEQEQEVSSVTNSDTLLVQTRSPLIAVEMGLGSVIFRQPQQRQQQKQQQQQQQLLLQQDPESEASSLLVDNKLQDREESVATLRSNSGTLNRLDVLQSKRSPLVALDLKDILNFETFTQLLTLPEQLQLKQLLPHANADESLRDMFVSPRFDSALTEFQELLAQGMFDRQHYQELLAQQQKQQQQQQQQQHGGDFVGEPRNKTSVKDAELPTGATAAAAAAALMMEEGHDDSGGDEGMLLDVPAAVSFQQAQLLNPRRNIEMSVEDDLIMGNTLHMAADWGTGLVSLVLPNGTVLNPS